MKEVSKKVIVIEDDAGVRRGVVKMLEKKFEVKAAGSPEEAMEMLKGEDFDAAVCDVHFPEIIDGVDLFRTSSGDSMRWIFMTGDANAAKALARQTGVPCLLKPFTRADLEKALE